MLLYLIVKYFYSRYFSQGEITDQEMVSDTGSTLYGIVTYKSNDHTLSSITNGHGPFSQPHKLLNMLDRLE